MKKLAASSLFALLLVTLLAACSGPGVTDIAGTWTGELISNAPTAIQLEFEQTGTSVSGTLSEPGGTEEYPLNGTVNGDRIEFEVTDDTLSGSITFEGLVEGNTMEGWAIGFDDAGDVTASQAFTVTRN